MSLKTSMCSYPQELKLKCLEFESEAREGLSKFEIQGAGSVRARREENGDG